MAFNVQLDLFGAIQKFIEARQINKWIVLGIELVCSFWFSACTSGGFFLTIHRPPWEALGEGLMVGSAMAVKVWRGSVLTRGMILALPEKEAEIELGEPTQVISK